METKYCTKCGKNKPLSGFHLSIRAKDGLQSWCKACRSEDQAEYYIEHREEKAAYNAARTKELTLYRRKCNLYYKYGITLKEYDEMLESQGNACAICGKTPEENGKRLYVDHNHKTGKVRGLLCANCNKALGFFQDNPELCRLAMLYLRRTMEN